MKEAWKKLLIQALIRTPVPVNARGHCSLFNIQRFVYRALQQAGIENRSPFTLWQIFSLRIQSRGNPAALRTLCIDKLRALHKPALNFDHFGLVLVLLTLAAGLTLFIAPKTANTYLSSPSQAAVLEYVIHPIEDLDAIETRLPLTGDYRQSSYRPLAQRELEGIDWIRRQPDSSYALQMLSASTLDNLVRFCKHHDICSRAAYYRTTVQGKQLYRLLYGVYRNHQAAKLARAELPEQLRQLRPWARQFSQIKSETRHH